MRFAGAGIVVVVLLATLLILPVLAMLAGTYAAASSEEVSVIPSAVYVAVANYFYKHGNINLAVKLFGKAVESGNSAVAHHNLGIIYYGKGDVADAEREFGRAIEANPSYARAHNSLALLLFHQGIYGEAVKHFSTVVELSPENAQAHFDLAVSLGNNARYGNGSISDLEEVLRHFRDAERLQPGYPHAVKNIEVVENVLVKYHELKGSLA